MPFKNMAGFHFARPVHQSFQQLVNGRHRTHQLVLVCLLFVPLLLWGSSALADDKSPRPEPTEKSPITLSPDSGKDIGFVYEAFMSPQQEGGEEEDTPAIVPSAFKSSEPSVPRNKRTSRGHAVLEFTKDLSKAYVFLAVENVNPKEVNMMHLHCGRPGQLGPIIVDFALAGNVSDYLADNVFTLEITNEDIVAEANQGSGPVAAFTSGCPIAPTIPNDRVKTIAGMELIARQGELYFNLHTKAQTYFGDIRGQFYPVDSSKLKQ